MKRGRAGFTLFEVMLSIVILAVMAGGIFGTIGAVISAVEELQTSQTRQMNQEALVELLRKNFAALPPKSEMLLEVKESGGGFFSEMTVEQAPGAFSWGTDAGFFGLIELGLEKGPDGLLRLVIRRLDSDETVRRRETPQTLTVLDGLRVFRWEFFDDQDRRWVGEWDNRVRKPNLVRLTFQLQGEEAPEQVTFALPWTSPRNASQTGA